MDNYVPWGCPRLCPWVRGYKLPQVVQILKIDLRTDESEQCVHPVREHLAEIISRTTTEAGFAHLPSDAGTVAIDECWEDELSADVLELL
jgi:hypothetical protein